MRRKGEARPEPRLGAARRLKGGPARGRREGGGRAGGAGWGRAAGAAACAGSEWLAAGGGSARPRASRPYSRQSGLQPRLLRLGWTRPHSALLPRGAAAAPPPLLLPPPPASQPAGQPVRQSVSQSVTERAARVLPALAASLARERCAWGGGGGSSWRSARGGFFAPGRDGSGGSGRADRLRR